MPAILLDPFEYAVSFVGDGVPSRCISVVSGISTTPQFVEPQATPKEVGSNEQGGCALSPKALSRPNALVRLHVTPGYSH